MKKVLPISLLVLCVTIPAAAQQQQEKNLFNHMDAAVTLGTTGLGIDLAMPVGESVRLRTGFSYVPRIEVPMTFGVQVGEDAAESKKKFDKLSNTLSNFTGQEVNSEVYTLGRPKFWNWNVMVDVFPLKNNRHWHVTAGFYLGPSKIAEAYNKTESMSTLVAINLFNNLRQRVLDSPVLNDEFYFYDHTVKEVLMNIGILRDMGIINEKDFPAELDDMYLDPKNNFVKRGYKNIANYGQMGVFIGTYKHDIVDDEGNVIHKKGDAYIMQPDENSMVKTDMKVNSFKPYVGIGYDGCLVKGNDRVKIGFDAGVMFWGGTPHLTTHDGTDLIHDVENVPGKVGDYVSIVRKAKVFPMVNARLSFRLF